MDVIRHVNGDEETVKIKSTVEFRILFSFEVIYALNEKFADGVLVEGNGYNTLNGNYQKETNILKKGNHYILSIDDVPNKIYEDELRYTVSRIYFEEPRDGKRVYSQTFGKWVTFEKVSDNTYKLDFPDGDNYYTYTNGVCTEVMVNRDYASFSFVMKPESLARVKKQ